MRRSLLSAALAASILGSAACARHEESANTAVAPTPGPDTSAFFDTSTAASSPSTDARIARGNMKGQPTTEPRDSLAIPDTGAAATTSEPIEGSRFEIRHELIAEAARLNRLVSAADLSGAARSALRLRDLAVAIGGRTAGLPKGSIEQVEEDITTLTQISESLRIQATGKNRQGVKAQNDLIQPLAARIVRLTK